MPYFDLVYMAPKRRMIQAKDMHDAQKQARMIVHEYNQDVADVNTLLRVETAAEAPLIAEVPAKTNSL